jgi:hypothetical protein
MDRMKFVDAFSRIRTFVKLNNLQFICADSEVNHVAEVLSLWEVRYNNKDITGVNIPGAPVLIENLKQMLPEEEVEQYGFTGEKLAGSVFFNRRTGEFLGDTIVKRRAKTQEILDLEARLLHPSRKSA